VLVALVAGPSCHPHWSTEAQGPVYEDPQHYSSRERETAICEQLRSIRLFRADGAELRKEMQACTVRIRPWVAELRWHIDVQPPADYQVDVQFLESQVDGPLVPTALHAKVSEWPCTDNCNHEDLKAVVPIVTQCVRDRASRPTRELVMPKVEEGSACAQTHRYPWCTRPTGPDEAHFLVREHYPFTGEEFELHIDVAADSADLELNVTHSADLEINKTFHLEGERVKLLREYLDQLWTHPTEGSVHRCRDEVPTVVVGRRAGAWKVWFPKGCDPPINTHYILHLAGYK
jgi:hypothetical protein